MTNLKQIKYKNLAFCAAIAPANMVNIPKTCSTSYKNCGKHHPYQVTQYKRGKDSQYAQGKRHYDRKESGYGGQTKPTFHKKAKTAKKVVLRHECVESTAGLRGCWLLGEASIVNWEVTGRGRASDPVLSQFSDKDNTITLLLIHTHTHAHTDTHTSYSKVHKVKSKRPSVLFTGYRKGWTHSPGGRAHVQQAQNPRVQPQH